MASKPAVGMDAGAARRRRRQDGSARVSEQEADIDGAVRQLLPRDVATDVFPGGESPLMTTTYFGADVGMM